ERWADFGHRATHEMTVAAKTILRAYYGRDPQYNYFVGASTGGQQSLLEAESYPTDYDGIVAGVPANNRTHLHAMFLWDWQAVHPTPASALSPAQLALLHQAVLKACVAQSGGAPGDEFLTDPRLCHFDPTSLLRPAGGGSGEG